MHTNTNNSNKETSCIFCQIVAGTAPCHKIWENERYLAFLSIFPNTEGFAVVLPKHHLSSYIFDHASDEINQLMKSTKHVASILVGKFTTVDRAALIFEGYGVNHLHAKLIPLHGTKTASWKHVASTIKTKFEAYPGYVSSHDAARESDKKLSELAAFLRS